MAKSSVQRAIKFSVDRLGYESLKPEQETVVRVFLGGKDVFAAFPYGLRQIVVFRLFFTRFWPFLATEPLQSIQTGLPEYINAFERATRKQKLRICLFSTVSLMFSQEADQNRYQRSDSIAADLTPSPRVNDRSPTTTASTSSSWTQIVVRLYLVTRAVN